MRANNFIRKVNTICIQNHRSTDHIQAHPTAAGRSIATIRGQYNGNTYTHLFTQKKDPQFIPLTRTNTGFREIATALTSGGINKEHKAAKLTVFCYLLSSQSLQSSPTWKQRVCSVGYSYGILYGDLYGDRVFTIQVLLMAVVALSVAGPVQQKTNKCAKTCPFDYTPICAGPTAGTEKPLSFGNACVLENYNCEKGLRTFQTMNIHQIVHADHLPALHCILVVLITEWVVKSQGECPGSQGVRLS